MTTSQYLIALKRGKLSICGKDTQEYLDRSERQLLRYSGGMSAIPKNIERLLRQRINSLLAASDQAVYSTGKMLHG